MRKFFARVTDIDAFKYHLSKTGTEWEKPDAEFVRELREGFKPNVQMKAGIIGHEAIEHAEAGTTLYKAGDEEPCKWWDWEARREQRRKGIQVWFGDETNDIEIEFLPEREQLVMKTYGFEDHDFVLRGRIDGAKPGQITDYKFARGVNVDKYTDSFQWRAYLDMMGEEYWEFKYSIFTTNLADDKTNRKKNRDTRYAHFDVTDHDEFTFTRYDGLDIDVREQLREFYEWSKSAGWEGRHTAK